MTQSDSKLLKVIQSDSNWLHKTQRDSKLHKVTQLDVKGKQRLKEEFLDFKIKNKI